MSVYGSASRTVSGPVIVGTNHRTGNLSLRDRLFVEDADVQGVLDLLRDRGISQAFVMSTCDRVEIAAISMDHVTVADAMRDVLAAHADIPPGELQPFLYCKVREEAVSHLFRVASSLDSAVVGEPQVLGQLKACHRMARDHAMVGGELEDLLQAAYVAAKRVRTQTAVGERPVSIAAVAVGISRDLFGSLHDASGLVIGNGEMGELIAREFQRAGLVKLAAIGASGRDVSVLAAQLDIARLPDTELAQSLVNADVIIAAVGGRHQFVNTDMIRTALKARRRKPQFIIDASLPRDVDAAVDRLEDAFLYDLGDLERLALDGLNSREAEALDAERIVQEEVARYLEGQRERDAAPIIADLRSHAAALKATVLAEANGDPERALHLFVQRLLHHPSEALRNMAAEGEDLDLVDRLVRQLFDLDQRKDDQS